MLVLAPELYLPLRQLGAQFHASADGLAVAERMLELLDAPPAPAPRAERAARRARADAPVRLEGVSFAYPARPGAVLDGLDLELVPGRDGRARRRERRGQEHGRRAAARPRASRRPGA